MNIRHARALLSASGAMIALASLSSGQVSSYTGGSALDAQNWCDGSNWMPNGVPADGSTISVPPGFFVNMFPCANSLRILGQVNAEGTIRFWTPVAFAAGGSLVNPIFDFSTDPVPIAGELALSGSETLWRGGIFAGGTLRNSGTLTVQRTSFGARPFPRSLVNGAQLTNEGTLRVQADFAVNASSTLGNQGSLICDMSATISRTDQSAAAVLNPGSITIPASQSLTISAGLTSNGLITSTGSLQLQSEVTLLGQARVEGGGLIRILSDPAEAITLGPCTLGGEGSFQLSSGLFRVVEILSSIRPGTAGRGVWIASTSPVDFSFGRMFIGEEGVLTWSAGRLDGDNPLADPPDIRIAQGARLNAVGSPGFSGGGDAHAMAILIEGTMHQDALVRLFDGTRVTVPAGGSYSLIHDRLDGDGTGSLRVQGTLDVNPRSGPTGSTAFINSVFVRLDADAVMNIDLADIITQNNNEGAPAFELGGNATVQVGPTLVFGESARWRAFGRTVITDGSVRIDGQGIFELASGASLLIGDAILVVDLEEDPPSPVSEFLQLGTLRADPNATGSGLRFRNTGRWNWRSGAVVFPQGSQPPVESTSQLVLDCGTCSLQSDLKNTGTAFLLDTLTLTGPGVEFFNEGTIELFGHVSEFAPGDGQLVNLPSGLISRLSRVNQTFSSINTTLDNRGEVQVVQGTLSINGPIVQLNDGILNGGAWVVFPGATLLTPGRTIHTVAQNTVADKGGTWAGFQPQSNFGRIVLRNGTTLPDDLLNLGDVDLDPAVPFSIAPARRYTQRAGATRLGPGSTLTSPQPMQVEGGEVSGTGTLVSPTVNNSGGDIKPGQSPGTLFIQGDYAQSLDGTLSIELAGSAPGSELDVLAISGTATLGGTLRVSLLNGYTPALGAEFVVLTAASVTGAFDALIQPDSGLPIGARLRAAYSLDSVALRVTAAADFNADGETNADDLGDYINCYFASPPCLDGDFNGDGNLDADDLGDFINAYFAS